MEKNTLLNERKKFTLPHIYGILFIVIVICTLMTWILPAGNFDRVKNAATGATVVVPGTYHVVEATPVGLFGMFKAIYNGFCDAGGIIFFVFIAYASINIIISSGAFNGLVAALLKVLKGKARVSVVPIFIFVIGMGSSTVGMSEEWYPFVPLFAGITAAMGFDAMVGLAVVALGAGLGYSGAMMNPFNVGVAQGIAEVPPMSGMGYRFFCFAVMVAVASFFVCRYALKVQADPSKSIIYGDSIKVSMDEETVMNTPFGIREKLILLTLCAGVASVVWGCKEYGWYLSEICAVFMIMGIISAVIMRCSFYEICKKFETGFTHIAMACMMLGLARGILMVLTDGNIIDTIVYYMSQPLDIFPPSIGAVVMLVVQTLLNFIIPSGSGQAATSMPIMTPLADLLGLNRDIAVLAFQFGDGLSNIVWPTGMPVIIATLAGVKVEKWWKFIVPVFLVLVGVQALLLVLAVAINFGG